MLAAGSSEITDFGPHSRQLTAGNTPKRPNKASSHRPGSGSGPGPMTTGGTSSASGNGNSGGALNAIPTTKVGSGGGGGGAMSATTVTATTGKATVSHGHSHGHALGRSETRSGRSAAAGRSNVDGFVGGIETYLGLIGWRKKCLYTLLLLLMLLIITNLVLTLWILKVMEFSTVIATQPLGPQSQPEPQPLTTPLIAFRRAWGSLKSYPVAYSCPDKR